MLYYAAQKLEKGKCLTDSVEQRVQRGCYMGVVVQSVERVLYWVFDERVSCVQLGYGRGPRERR